MRYRRYFVAILMGFSMVAAVWAQEPAPSPDQSARGFGAADLVGSWSGSIVVSGRSLHVVFNIQIQAGALVGTMDSPDQGVKGIRLSSVSLAGRSVDFAVASIGGAFSGSVSADGATAAGFWKQGAATLSLVLKKSSLSAEIPPQAPAAAPQEPKPPFPYASEDLKFSDAAAGIELAGTLTIPKGRGPFPGLVLVTGSGPQNRDEEILGHKPFLVIADYLARKGVAVLRYDDRGVGASGGDFGTATTFDFADDAESAFTYLLKRPEIDPSRAGIAGHSEGGLIAPIVASRNPKVRFVILFAGPGVRGDQLLLQQNEAIAEASGAGAAAIKKANALNAELYAIAEKPGSPAEIDGELRAALNAAIESDKSLSAQQVSEQKANVGALAAQLETPWMRAFLTIDPAVYLSKLSIPVLAMIGSKDLQVPAGPNLAAIAAALATSRSTAYSIDKLEGLNHLFQHAKTGLPQEYAGIQESFATSPLDLALEFLSLLP